MPGLGPGIHAVAPLRRGKTWVAGTSPAMTGAGIITGAENTTPGARTSRLPSLEIDPRIDPGVGEVRNQVHDEAEEREDVEVGEHDRIVAVDDRLERQKAQSVERK